MTQLDLFTWAESRPTAEIIDLLPALCRRAAMELIYRIPTAKGDGKVIQLGRAA